MKVLLFGKDGQLGWELQRSLAVLGELVALGRSGDAGAGLCGDLSRTDEIAATVRSVRPDVIVNAAAYTAVDKAEVEQELAMRVNGEAPGVLANTAHECGAWMIHYSTNYVFDGSGTRPWREDDAAAPLNAYGVSKLEGERRVAGNCNKHLILRTSWLYGARGGNFARTMLRLATERERLTVIDDQFGAPTGADLLADATAHAVRACIANAAPAGIYHVAAGGETSWNGYARFLVAEARRADCILRASVDAIDRVPSSAFQTAARRPHNSRLDTARFRTAFGLSLPPWQQGVSRLVAEIR
jgi:dTDP-4-dehydrorhamnose reductase